EHLGNDVLVRPSEPEPDKPGNALHVGPIQLFEGIGVSIDGHRDQLALVGRSRFSALTPSIAWRSVDAQPFFGDVPGLHGCNIGTRGSADEGLLSLRPAKRVLRPAPLTLGREPVPSLASSAGGPGGLSCWKEREGRHDRETGWTTSAQEKGRISCLRACPNP